MYLSLSANYPIPFTNTIYWPCISPSANAPNHRSNCLIFFKHYFYESLFHIKAKSLPPTCMHVPTVAIMFLLIKWSSMFTVLVFWLSDTFTFFAYGILIIVTMMTFKPQFIQVRNKPSLLSTKGDTIAAIFLLLRKTNFLC